MSPVATVRFSTTTALRPRPPQTTSVAIRHDEAATALGQPARGRQELANERRPVREVRWVCGLAPHHGQPNDPEVVNDDQLDRVAVDS